jgi:hypothetical protein
MKRLLIVPFLLLATPALSQSGNTAANQNACSRDALRFCRAKMSDGDMVVLGCLKDNRAKLGKACAKVLAENGQ